MDTLRLWFERGLCPQLKQAEFVAGSTKSSRVTVRGKVVGCPSTGTFAWSRGVRALCLLLVQSKLGADPRGAHLRLDFAGERGSDAASFDYALSKSPNWLVEFFGTDSSGTCVAAHLFRRVNPERKRPGPVRILLNHHRLTPDRVELFVNDRPLVSWDELQNLYNGLLPAVHSEGEDSGPNGLPAISAGHGSLLGAAWPSMSEFSFSTLGELDTFFGQLHGQLKQNVSADSPLVGELAHAWWPLISFCEKQRESTPDSDEVLPISYSARGTTSLDRWVANEYRRDCGGFVGARSEGLPYDFWVYGDVVTKIFVAPSTTRAIEDEYNNCSGIESFDLERFRRRCLARPDGATLLVLRNRTLAAELRRHVLSANAGGYP